MDDDKSLVEKTIEAVKDIATSVTDAAKHAMEPKPLKPGEQIVLLPAETPFMAEPMMPSFVVIPAKKRPQAKKKNAAKKVAPKKSKKVAPKKSTNKSSRKSGKKTVKKTVKKAKKKAKSKR